MTGLLIRKGELVTIPLDFGNKYTVKPNLMCLRHTSLFGQPDTPYDYRDVNLGDAKKTLQQLVDKHETMRKKINVKVMNMIDK
jgi:hypothetical protein